MKRMFEISLLLIASARFTSADNMEKIEKELIALEDMAGRMKSRILKLEGEISFLRQNIKITEENISRTRTEMEEIIKVLNIINIEKRINPAQLKDIEMKNIRYGECISRLVSKYNENLSLLNNLMEDYQNKEETLNMRLSETYKIQKELEEKIEKVYLVMLDKKREYGALNIKAKREIYAGKEESIRKMGEFFREINRREDSGSTNKEVGEFKIIWPIREGDIIREFGPYYDETVSLERFSRGIVIRSRFLSEVFCVADGRILFAGWLRGFGNTVIAEHKGGFISVYSHLARIEVEKGDEVKGMDILGFVGDTGSNEGVILYFELRRNGKAVDPSNYLK